MTFDEWYLKHESRLENFAAIGGLPNITKTKAIACDVWRAASRNLTEMISEAEKAVTGEKPYTITEKWICSEALYAFVKRVNCTGNYVNKAAIEDFIRIHNLIPPREGWEKF